MKYYKQPCPNCNKTPTYSLLCLICGDKVCFMDTCCRNLGTFKNDYQYVDHVRKCGNGDGVHVHLYSGEITLALQGKFTQTKNNLYLNHFGGSLKGKSINED